MAAPFTLAVTAKVNLYLRVAARRADGYHEVETVLQSVALEDRLSFAPAPEWRLACDRADVPLGEENLVSRAAARLRERFAVPAGRAAHVRIEKRIPVGAGMGGGSADAAAALVGLARLWELPAGGDELRGLAAALGADVPFFLEGGTAVGRGRGEIITPVLPPRPPLWLVVVKPPFSVSTAWAYRAWTPPGPGGPALDDCLAALASGDPARVGPQLRNDLEPAVAAAHPAVAALRAAMLAGGAVGARMTGSGSAVFAVAAGEQQARRIAAGLDAGGGEVHVLATRGPGGPVEAAG